MFEFAVKLTDNVSAAATASSAATRRLQRAMAELAVAESTTTTTAQELAAAHIELAAASEASAEASGEAGVASAVESMINPAALATAAVVALTAAVAGLGAMLIAGAKEALSASEAHRRLTEQLGAGTLEMIRKLETEVPQSEAQLSEWARTLRAAGVTDLTKLHDQMLAVASAEAIVTGGGEKVKSLLATLAEQGGAGVKRFNLKQLAGTGVTQEEFLKQLGMTPTAMQAAIKKGKFTGEQIASALTKALNEKGKGPLEVAMSDLSTTFVKFKDNVAKLFEDVNVKPFLDELRKTAQLFDQGTATGKTFKFLITSTFNALFSAASKVFPYVRAFMLQLAINALKVYIAVKPTVVELGKMFAKKPSAESLSWIKQLTASAMALAPIIIVAVRSLMLLASVLQKVSGWMQAGSSASKSLIQGLVSGIAGGGGAVASAMKQLATTAITSFKSALGIASPSKVMFEHGHKNVAGGLAGGLNAGKPQVARAMAQLTGAPKPNAPSANKGGGNKYNLQLTVNGGGDAQKLGAALKIQLDDYFEQMALTNGG